MATPIQVTFDCADPDRLATFWAAAIGYKKQDPPEGYATWEDWLRDNGFPEEEWDKASAVVDPEGVGPRFYFQKVPEGKTAKNRMHLDLNVSRRGMSLEEKKRVVKEEADRLVALGAKRLRDVEEHGEFCINMLDPEGNEFDVQ